MTEVGKWGSRCGSKPCKSQKPLLSVKAGLQDQLFPPTARIFCVKRGGSWVMLHYCRWKVHHQAWWHICFTNQLVRATVALWRVGTLVSCLNWATVQAFTDCDGGFLPPRGDASVMDIKEPFESQDIKEPFKSQVSQLRLGKQVASSKFNTVINW